jgi:hypothetical protein
MPKHKLELVDEIQLRKAGNENDIQPKERPSDWIKRIKKAVK